MANISIEGGTLVDEQRKQVVETIAAVNEGNPSVRGGSLVMKRIGEAVDVIQGGIQAMEQPQPQPEPERTPFDPDRQFSQSFREGITPPELLNTAREVQSTDGKVDEPVYREIDYKDPTEVPLGREISKQFDDSVYAPLGKEYRDDQVVSNSYYKTEILDRPNKGNSRIGGDVSIEVQERAMKSIVSEGIRQGMNERQIAMTLAIARHESGFNPDAAAGTTTAHGLGQFVNKTGNSYGLDDTNRWIMEEQAKALVTHTLDNYKLAENRNQGEEYVYKYHHDGASKDFGGLGLSQKFVMPNVETYVNFVRQITTDSDRQEEFLKDRGNPTVGVSSLRPKMRPEQ